MKKKILFTIIGVLCIVIGMCVISTQAATYTGSCGDSVTYSFNTSTGVLTISGTGAMADYTSSSSVPWYSKRSYIKSAVIEDSVTSIGNYAFYDCDGLTSITIGGSVTSIGDWAFYSCSGLTSITIPDSVTSIGAGAFESCTGLTNVTIGNGVTSIGDNAFYYCTDLKSVTIGGSVTSIGNYAFFYCSGLTSIEIPDSVTSIGTGAFYYCTSLTSITIPDSVTSIGKYAFCNCSGLTNVTIGNGVTSIGYYAFSSCTGLTSITVEKENGYYCSVDGNLFNKDKTKLVQYAIGKTDATYIIPDSVTSIGYYAFSECSGLTSIEIPDSVTSIGNYAFYGCTGLTSVIIPNSVTSIGDSAFDSCTSITSVTIGGSVTSIGYYAFYKCYSLTSITIPDSVTSMGNYAFENCIGLTNVIIGDGVTNIGGYAFSSCYGLTSITIGGSVTSIGTYAFESCIGLTDVYYSGSEEEWNNISIGYGNEWLLNATIHYNYVPIDSIIVDTDYLYLEKYESAVINFEIKPDDASVAYIFWNSSDEGVATVQESEDGKSVVVTAVGIGCAEILADIYEKSNDYWGTIFIPVEVKEANIPVEGVAISSKSKSLTVGETITLTASVMPSDATEQGVCWHSSDESIATVDENGIVTAKKAGGVYISVTTIDGNYSARCLVVVSEPERDYKVEKLTGEVKNGTFYAEAEITKNSNRNEKDMIVIAVYKDSIMIDMIYMKANLLEDQTVSFGGILTGGEDVTLKAFVWDSMTDMNTLSNVIEQ